MDEKAFCKVLFKWKLFLLPVSQFRFTKRKITFPHVDSHEQTPHAE